MNLVIPVIIIKWLSALLFRFIEFYLSVFTEFIFTKFNAKLFEPFLCVRDGAVKTQTTDKIFKLTDLRDNNDRACFTRCYGLTVS